ncbi:MAG: hypothetical protein P4K83_00100 [Terracidiphilus sp.]|nr:hypothetical protein [Terracidiphilus sp.]
MILLQGIEGEMMRYLNLNGGSGVLSYEVGTDSIIVEFKDHWKYLYNYATHGQIHVEAMKALATIGSGLNSYINKRLGKNVRDAYARKWQ